MTLKFPFKIWFFKIIVICRCFKVLHIELQRRSPITRLISLGKIALSLNASLTTCYFSSRSWLLEFTTKQKTLIPFSSSSTLFFLCWIVYSLLTPETQIKEKQEILSNVDGNLSFQFIWQSLSTGSYSSILSIITPPTLSLSPRLLIYLGWCSSSSMSMQLSLQWLMKQCTSRDGEELPALFICLKP